MGSYTVQLIFNDGVNTYTFPLVHGLADPKEGMKATVIEGNRGDGSIIIPAGKKSQTINVRGTLFDADGYADLTTLMNEMRTKVTTNAATLTLRHFSGTAWVTDWSYTVRRISEIEFQEDSQRTDSIEYNISFIVTSY